MNKVYIYRQKLNDFYEPELVELCEKSWEKWGWEVVQTGPQDAQKHHKFDEINANRASLTRGKAHPDRNMVSYYKWLAFDTALNKTDMYFGLALDFDIINYGFRPQDLDRLIIKFLLKGRDLGRVAILGEYGYSFDSAPYLRPPTPVVSTGFMAKKVIQAFCDYKDGSQEAHKAKRKRPNSALMQGVDEQSIFNDYLWDSFVDHIPCCPMYNSTKFESAPWRQAKLVHYTNWSVAKKHVKTRTQTILQERPPL